MPLPKIEKKYHRTKLISNNKEIKFRPFTIGEQKQIMLVKETAKEEINIYKAIADLVQNCTEGIEVLNLYNVDFEKLFYDMRTIADGSILPFNLNCTNKECKHKNEDMSINTQEDLKLSNKSFLKEVKVKEYPNLVFHIGQPKLKDNFIVETNKYKNDNQKAFDLMVYCIYRGFVY